MTNARELSNRLVDLLRNERNALAEFILALADFDRERRWVELGHNSLFAFLSRDLGLSKGAAFYRMTAARLVQRHPEVIEPLRDGRLCLTNVVELSKVITAVNAAEVVPRFFHLSKIEAKEVVAELSPTPAPARTVVTPIRSEPATASLTSVSWLDEPAHANSGQPTQEGSTKREAVAVRASPEPMRAAPTIVEPRTADLSRIHVTVSRAVLRKLDAVRDALSHSHPGASDSDILGAALDLLLERSARRKGLVAKPRTEPPPSAPDHVPAHVRRAVWTRDQGRCQWPLEGGGVCGSTVRVQLDHVIPRANGGPPTVENLRCLCWFHNDLAARQEFGDAVMDRYTG